MALVDIETFKSYVNSATNVNPANEALLQAALDAAGVGVNEAIGRNIRPAATVASDRRFVSRRGDLLFIDDCAEVTGILDDTYTLVADDYQLEPVNGLSAAGEYRPYSEIRRRGGWYDSYGWASITVTARWGWETVPSPIVEAVKILGKDIAANRDVSFGIAAFTEYAAVRARANPQVWNLIQPYSLHVGLG